MPAVITAPSGFNITDLNVINQNIGALKVAKVSQAGLNGPFGFKADCKDGTGAPIPNGDAQGTALIDPGTARSPELAKLVNHFAWQGKVFDASSWKGRIALA